VAKTLLDLSETYDDLMDYLDTKRISVGLMKFRYTSFDEIRNKKKSEVGDKTQQVCPVVYTYVSHVCKKIST
jgi:hypothetical protein